MTQALQTPILPYHLLAEALRLYGSGLDAADIAQALGISASATGELLKVGCAVGRAGMHLRRVHACHQAGLGVSATSRKTGICTSSVTRSLERMGFGTRMCRRCKQRKANTDKGACFICAYGGSKRTRDRIRRKQAQALPEANPADLAQARKPCPHPPGSIERMQTYALRAACGLRTIFNPKDAGHEAYRLHAPAPHNAVEDYLDYFDL